MSTSPQDSATEKAGPAAPQAVLAALAQVTGSAAFARADRPARFLRHLVETTLSGDTQRLKETVLGVEVFGRDGSWDPRLDAIVRQEAARLRKRLARYYETEGAGSALRIQLPVGGYVPVFESSVAEESPTATLPTILATIPEAPAGARRNWKVWVAAAAMAVLAGTVAGVWRWRSAAAPSLPSIAVLPFANLSPDPANRYFAEGLTDEVTDLLAHNRALRVSARASASQFNSKSSDLATLGRKLNVSSVLEGSVDRDGDRIRIIAHLERVSDGSLVWSNTYERRTSDLFAVQSELARAIAGNLNAAAGMPAAPQHVPGAAAHDAYMKGRYDLQQLTPASLDQAEADFQRAIAADPDYAAAWAGLGLAKFNRSLAWTQYRTEADRQGAVQAFQKALELDPMQPGAHSALASMKLQYDWDWTGAEQELREALAGPPDADANVQFAFLLVEQGRFAEAEPYVARAQDLDPFGSQTLARIGQLRYLENRFPQALDMLRKASSVAPEMVAPLFMSALIRSANGQADAAIAELRRIEEHYPQGHMYEAVAQAAGGHREEALRLMHPYEEQYRTAGVPMQWFALCYGGLRDEPNAVKWLSRSADQHESQVLNMGVNPAFASMRTAPAFLALEKRIGLKR